MSEAMHNAKEMTLLFFDIDGTMVDTCGSGRAAFINALHSVFGWSDSIDYIQFTGATDLDVLRRICNRNECELTEDEVARFFEQLPRELEKTILQNETTALPGVTELLSRLGEYPNVIIGLITGNIESCARIKLQAAGIRHHFILGAFGHEHGDRDEIAKLALRRAEDLLGPEQCIAASYLIGDSPSDISAAHAIGAHAVAVATGRPNATELVAAGADTVLEDLADTDGIIRLFLN